MALNLLTSPLFLDRYPSPGGQTHLNKETEVNVENNAEDNLSC